MTIKSAHNPSALIAITDRLSAAAQRDPGGPVIVDFSRMRGMDARVEPAWGAVLSNILAVRFGDVPLGATLPRDHSARVQLARAGVFFALARNRRFDWSSLQGGTDRIVRRWTRDWVPAEVQQPLFRIDDARDGQVTPTTLEPDIVAFLNPDRIPPSAVADDSAAVIYPWLRDLVGGTAAGTSKLDRGLQQDISLVIFELLGNVREHARLSRDKLCSMNLFVTEGGRGARLYVTVFDTGVGMPHTLRQMPFMAEVAPNAQVAAAFNGELPKRERDRGRGLHRIAGLVDRLAGHMFVATGPTEHGAVVVQHDGRTGTPVSAKFVPDLAVCGTVVMLTLPIPGTAGRAGAVVKTDGERR